MTIIPNSTPEFKSLGLALDALKAKPYLRLFPVQFGNKAQPLLKNYLKEASGDPDQILGWHRYWTRKFKGQECWWGIAPALSGLVFADIDTKEGKRGQETFELFEVMYDNAWPETLITNSPSGGRHHWYRGEALFAVGKSTSSHPDIDFAQYVILPGCLKADGTGYTVRDDREIAQAPDWFYKEAKKRPTETSSGDNSAVIELDKPGNIETAENYLRDEAPPAIEGQGGDSTTLQVAMAVRDYGISEPMILQLMLDNYNERCEPPWSYEELEKKVRNAGAYAQNPAGSKTAEVDFSGDDADADAIVTFGDPAKIAAARARAKADKIAQSMAPPKAERPQVKVFAGLLHEAMDETQAIVIKQARKTVNKNGGSTIADQIFQRDGKLVRLNRNLHLKQKPKGDSVIADTKRVDGVTVDSAYQEKNALTIVEVRAPWLATRLGRAIDYVGPSAGKPGQKPKLKSKNVPLPLVNQLIGDETQWKFPALFSTIEAPTLRADGSILDEPGYDPKSGMFFDPGDTVFPKIKASPSIAEGRAAIKYLDGELLSSFPFVDADGYRDVSRSVALAMMLTGPVRRGLKIAPAFAVDSNEPESGKSMMTKAAGALMTGREIAGRPFAESEEERRKSLGTAFFEARPVLFFDNVDSIIEGASLEMALTTPMFEDRKLGSHEGISAPTNSLTLFSANHISVGGDGMTTRVLVSRIVPTKTLAQRLKDGDFRHPFLIDWIIENRPKLIAAVLTALRAFIVHGKDGMPPTVSRFPEWGSLIGNALIWYGYADPTRGGDAIRAADPTKEAMRAVVRSWLHDHRRDAVTAAELIASPTTREAIAAALGARPNDVTAMHATMYIDKMIGVGLDMAYTVERVKTSRSVAKRFRLVQTTPDELLPDPCA